MLNLIGGTSQQSSKSSIVFVRQEAKSVRIATLTRGADLSQNVDVTNLGLLDRVCMTNPGRSNCIRPDLDQTTRNRAHKSGWAEADRIRQNQSCDGKNQRSRRDVSELPLTSGKLTRR
jgi:hypothetical protein